MATQDVRVRIGPSPTGDPHVGTAYIALFNYVFAKKHGGSLVLRVEDTDQTRSKPEWEEMLVEAMHWLGLEFDESPEKGGPFGPYRQSERGAIYREHTEQLLSNGSAYKCFCTSERLEELRRQKAQIKGPPGYDGHCRELSAQEVQGHLDAGDAYVVRLKVPHDGQTIVHDRLRGEVVFENTQVDDQVLMKSDGMPTYHLANVVDDHLMQITHVIRAEEWVSSTPKHVLLYRAFGWDEPVWVHMPLLRNSDKSKISKRKNPVSLNYYRQAGFLREALLNYLGMMGWSMPDGSEKFNLENMIKEFDFDRISLGGPIFDLQKLTWLNGLYLRDVDAKQMLMAWKESIFTEAMLDKVAPLVHERIEKLEDFIDHIGFFFNGDLIYDESATKFLLPKGREPKEMVKLFEQICEKIDGLAALSVESVETLLKEVVEKTGFKNKEVFLPVRVAVTGTKASPPLYDSMAVLGKERCRRRLRNAMGHLKTL
jgi:glutamyl-tRNA synthetase